MKETKGKISKFVDKEKPLRKYKKPLPIQLSVDEKLAINDEAGALNTEIQEMETEEAKRKAAAKTAIQSKRDELSKLLKSMSTGAREAEVEVADVPIFEQNKVEVVRLDTKEVVDTRAMVAAERQKEIKGAQPEGDKKN